MDLHYLWMGFAGMVDLIFLLCLLIGFISFFWGAVNGVALMRCNTRDRSEQKQAPFSEPFNALLMPGLGAEGLALRRRVWAAFFACIVCVVVSSVVASWM